MTELIAKPPALPETRTPDPHFSRIAHWRAMFPGGFAITSYVKNYNLGFEIPYSHGGEQRTYIPDFILRVDDGYGEDNPLNLIVEIKGQRLEDDKAKSEAMETLWIPGVNRLKGYGRWAFAEITNVYEIERVIDDIAKRVKQCR